MVDLRAEYLAAPNMASAWKVPCGGGVFMNEDHWRNHQYVAYIRALVDLRYERRTLFNRRDMSTWHHQKSRSFWALYAYI